jgi:hypothetical protein
MTSAFAATPSTARQMLDRLMPTATGSRRCHTRRSLPRAAIGFDTVGYTARVRNAIRVNKIRGFFNTRTHINWTSKEAVWRRRSHS